MNRAFNLLEQDKGIRVGMAGLQDDDPDDRHASRHYTEAGFEPRNGNREEEVSPSSFGS